MSKGKNVSKKDMAFYGFVAFCVIEWAKTHVVLTSPCLIELFGTDTLTYHHHPELKEGFKW